MKKETAPTFSVVNGKVMYAGTTARIELPPVELARLLNDMLAALRGTVELAVGFAPHLEIDPRVKGARAAVARATGGAP